MIAKNDASETMHRPATAPTSANELTDVDSAVWLRAVLASTLDPVISIDAAGTIRLASNSVERIFGWKPEELVGRNVAMLMPEPYSSEHDQHLRRYHQTGHTTILGRSREFVGVRKDGTEFPCEVSVSQVELPSGEPVFTGIVRDITDRREAEKELKRLNESLEQKNKELEAFAFQAEKLASLGRLAASVAHAIRNPLTAVKLRLYSVRRAIGDKPKLVSKMQVISEEINRLESVLRNFLDFSRPPALNLQPQNVAVLMDKSLELMCHQLQHRRIEVIRNEEIGLPLVVADADQLKEVFLNLLTNAADVMTEGGTIRIGTSVESNADGRRMVVVRVRDSGPGVPPELAQRVFEPFYSTKEDGTGLGLCISAQIVERHGGRLTLEPVDGPGACFAVRIPAGQDLNG